jgi:hypothetical protein
MSVERGCSVRVCLERAAWPWYNRLFVQAL